MIEQLSFTVKGTGIKNVRERRNIYNAHENYKEKGGEVVTEDNYALKYKALYRISRHGFSK